jgi:hypothetical protein
VGNCLAHPSITVKELYGDGLAFLPQNMTTKLQPLDQGVIKNLKHHYCKRTIQKILELVWENTQCYTSGCCYGAR